MPVLIPVLLVGGVGLFCSVMLVLAARFLSVREDETVARIRACLPGANCGACGYTGCDGYAKALAEDPDLPVNLCVPGADAVAHQLAEVADRPFQDVVEQTAYVACRGDCAATAKKAEYCGIPTCAGAAMYYGGDGACRYGCLGYGDCAAVCPQHAICVEDGIAHIDPRLCNGCGLCAKVCPHHIIRLMPSVMPLAVLCSNKDKGAVTRKVCSAGCIGCRKCEKNCPVGAVKVTDNLAVIDDSLCIRCGKCVEGCPVRAIVMR